MTGAGRWREPAVETTVFRSRLTVVTVFLLLACCNGCRTMPEAGPVAAPLPPGATGPGTVLAYTGAGGRILRYRVVRAAEPRRYLLYLHGISSHGTWFLPAAESLAAAGCTTFLLDRRGSGLNRSQAAGDASSCDLLLEDIRLFRAQLPVDSLHLVGLSWGGKLATAAALDQPEGLRSLVLITPGLASKVDLSFGAKAELLGGLLLGGTNHIDIPIQAEMFTDTPKYLDFIRGDSWRLHQVTGRFLLCSLGLDHRIRRNIETLVPPVLLVLADRDRIIDNPDVLSLLSPLPHGQVRIHHSPQAIHSVQFDQREELVTQMCSFYDELEGKNEDNRH